MKKLAFLLLCTAFIFAGCAGGSAPKAQEEEVPAMEQEVPVVEEAAAVADSLAVEVEEVVEVVE